MPVETLHALLLWSTVINYLVLLCWFAIFSLAHNWMYQLHANWFRLSVERFDTIHYAGMAGYKIAVLVFNLVPYLALHIVS